MHCVQRFQLGGARYPGILQPGACVIFLSKDGLRYVTGLYLRALGTSSPAGIQAKSKTPRSIYFAVIPSHIPLSLPFPTPQPIRQSIVSFRVFLYNSAVERKGVGRPTTLVVGCTGNRLYFFWLKTMDFNLAFLCTSHSICTVHWRHTPSSINKYQKRKHIEKVAPKAAVQVRTCTVHEWLSRSRQCAERPGHSSPQTPAATHRSHSPYPQCAGSGEAKP